MTDTTKQVVLNTKAKEYVPKKKIEASTDKPIEELVKEDKEDNKEIKFNLEAKEFKPKNNILQNTDFQIDGLEEAESDEENEDAVYDDLINQELDDPMPIDDDEESDEDKWFPKFKDCTCCEGYIYKCSGDVCKSLGVCFCKAQEDYDPDV